MKEHPDWLRRFAEESNRIEGIMGPAQQDELDALAEFLSRPHISGYDLARYVAVVAPGHLMRTKPGMNVRVGGHVAPEGGEAIPEAVGGLCVRAYGGDTPYDVHVAYELLHPFTDGNGRSGRALWLWQHMQQGTDARPKALGFLHTFYYEALSHART